MSYSLSQGAVAEPVSLAEAKAHLAVDHSDDDTNITTLITAARKRFESETNRLLAARTCVLTLNDFPRQQCEYTDGVPAIRVPVWPVESVEYVKYFDADGTQQTLDGDDWTTFLGRKPSLVYPVYGVVWPTIRLGKLGAVSVEFTAGVDPEIAQGKAAMLVMIEHWMRRDGESDGVPPAAQSIMNGLSRPMYT